jgi:hypothetical protein
VCYLASGNVVGCSWWSTLVSAIASASGSIDVARGQGKQTRLLCFVLSEKSLATPSFVDQLKTDLAQYDVDVQPLSNRPDQNAAHLISVDNIALAVMFVDSPVPQGTFDRSIRLNWMWEGVGRAVKAHRSHVVISTLNSYEGHDDLLKAAAAVSRVAWVLAGQASVTAVYWESADLLVPSSMFREDVHNLEPDRVPASCWVQFFGFPGPKGEVGITTKGLLPFIGRELELVPKALPQRTMLMKAYGIAQWLILQGLLVKDGDTCGASAEEIMRVAYKDKGVLPPNPVLQIDIERPS